MNPKPKTKTKLPTDHWVVNPDNPGKFEGFEPPDANFTLVPNALFEHLPSFTGNELKVLLYIVRQTLGWHKLWNAIGLTQFGLGTESKTGEKCDYGVGMAKRSVRRAITGLEKKGFIITKRKAKRRTHYRLNFAKKRVILYLTGVQNAHRTGVQNAHTQKKEIYSTPAGLKINKFFSTKDLLRKTPYEQMKETRNRLKGDGLTPDYSASQN